MRRSTLGFLAVIALVASGCAPPTEDSAELRRFLGTSEREPVVYTYREASEEREFTAEVSFEDDLRHKLAISSQGRLLMEWIVSDDALALRFVDPEFPDRLSGPLGHPAVEQALREGRWVIDPSGAPPPLQVDGGEATAGGNPLVEALEPLRHVRTAIGEASEVREFNFEDLDYRPSLDPFEYPDETVEEVRYDLWRPMLPKGEDAISGGQGDVVVGHFRKLSVFVNDGRVDRVCEFIDVEGHEDFVELKERGREHNPFQAGLLERIREGQTSTLIRERKVLVDLTYPGEVDVELPEDAFVGRLEEARQTLQEGFQEEILEPEQPVDVTECMRTEDRPRR